jgi:hypothetical protein
MNEPEDEKLKAEIDKIMRNVSNILNKIENIDPTKNNDSQQNKD